MIGSWILSPPRSLEVLSQRLLEDPQPLRLVINATGRLHGGSLSPEKRLQQVCADQLMESFAINAAGPLLLAKAIEPALKRDRPFSLCESQCAGREHRRQQKWRLVRLSRSPKQPRTCFFAFVECGVGAAFSTCHSHDAASRHYRYSAF